MAQVLSHPQLIFPSEAWFFGNLFAFPAVKNRFKINILHIPNPNLTK
jgi:hypothetical protein